MVKCRVFAAGMAAVLFLGAFSGCQSEPKENPATSVKEEDAVAEMGKFPQGSSEGKKLGYQLELPEEGEQIAVVTTSLGEIRIRLFPEEAPKTVYNFKKHAMDGYYDGLTFHRVMKDFMIQGGDPKGDGTGGESVWKQEFEDEFSKNLINLRGSLSMANAGSNTNGSQFFINQAGPVPSGIWESLRANYEQIKAMNKDDRQQVQNYYGYTFLNTDLIGNDYKSLYEKNGGNPTLDGAYNAFEPQRGHTVFGQVFAGMEVVDKIAGVPVEGGINKPNQNVVIEKVEIVAYSK